MSIHVILFANLREELEADSLEIEATGVGDVPALIAKLAADRGQQWHETLTAENILVAINQELTKDSLTLKDGDEVAFFPPVTGG